MGEPDFERWDRETWSAGYLFRHAFNDALTFENNLRYTRNTLESRWIFRGGLESDLRTLRRSAWVADEHATDLAVDTRVVWKFETGAASHTLLVGFDYMQSSSDSLTRWGLGVPILDLFDPVYFVAIQMPPVFANLDLDNDHQGIYLQDQLKIGRLLLLAGGRRDEATTTAHDLIVPGTTRQRDDAFTSRLGAIYNFDNGLAPYLSYSESFEPVAGTDFEGAPFVPLEGRQYEIGVKYQPTGTANQLSLAVFDLTLNNVATNDPDPDHQAVGFFQVQTGEVRTRGAELEGRVKLGGAFDLIAAYTYLDDEVTQSNGVDLGKRRPQIPAHTGSLWARYVVPAGAFSGLDLGLGMRFVGESRGDPGNTFSVPGYTGVDLAMNYAFSGSALSGWQLGLNVNNLFDKYYIASCVHAVTCYMGRSRSARATVNYRW